MKIIRKLRIFRKQIYVVDHIRRTFRLNITFPPLQGLETPQLGCSMSVSSPRRVTAAEILDYADKVLNLGYENKDRFVWTIDFGI